MLRKFAVALLAASVFTAPVFAQGTGAPAKTETRSDSAAPAATPKVVTAKPTLKSAKLKRPKHYARHHAKHVQHVAHVKRVKHVKTTHAVRSTKGASQVRAQASKATTGQNGAAPAPKAKSNVN